MIDEVMKYAAIMNVNPKGRSQTRDTTSPNSNTKSLSATQILITPHNYDPNDPSKRPDGWIALRNKRVIVKEQIDRLGRL